MADARFNKSAWPDRRRPPHYDGADDAAIHPVRHSRPVEGLPHGRGRGARAARSVDLTPRRRRSSSCCSARPAPGKSTLLNILGGLDVPTSGQVLYRDADLTHADEAALTAYRRRHVGFVFQFYNLIPSLTARENVALVTEIADAPDDARGGARAWCSSRRAAAITFPPSSPAASSSAWRSPAPSPSGRPCCSATSRPARSTSRPGIVVLEALARVNAELGTTTVVITHNAAIAADGRSRRPSRRRPRGRRSRIARPRSVCRASCRGDATIVCALNRKLLRDLLADEGAGAGHRHGRRGRRRDVRDVPVELRLAAADPAAPTTSASASPTSSPRSSARPLASPPRSRPSRASRPSRRASWPT